MFIENEKVLVIDGIPNQPGVVEKVSTWDVVNHHSVDTPPDSRRCYFVRVPSWDNGTNGGRWLDEGSLNKIQQEDHEWNWV